MKEAFPDMPKSLQEELIGPGRLKMYKAGELTLDEMVVRETGELWLMKELKQGLHRK